MKTKNKSNLAAWLADPRADQYFQKAFLLKMDILAALVRGAGCNLAAIARRHGVTRAAASKQATKAKTIYGLKQS